MTAMEMIEFYKETYDKKPFYIENAISIGNYYLLALNYSDGFRAKVMQALISWKIGCGEPQKLLCEAVDFATEAINVITNMSTEENILINFPGETAKIISSLVNKNFDIPDFETKGIPFETLLDYELGRSLQGINNKAEWDNLILKNQSNKRAKLAIQTYSLYRDLIFNQEKERTHKLVSDLEELFLKRRDNAYYSGGHSIEGGGLDNEVTVDYRFSAILKYIHYDRQPRHIWKWG